MKSTTLKIAASDPFTISWHISLAGAVSKSGERGSVNQAHLLGSLIRYLETVFIKIAFSQIAFDSKADPWMIRISLLSDVLIISFSR